MRTEDLQAEERLSRQLRRYAGKWVAVRRHEVIADADSFDALLTKLAGRDVDRVFDVPADEDLTCFF